MTDVAVRHPSISAHTAKVLTEKSTLGDILDHPSFAGFAPLILPWDGRPYDRNMAITEIGSLLLYHTEVDPETALTSLNRMIDDSDRGQQIFFNFYTDAERLADQAKRNTGLFYFRGKPGAPFAIVAPGGGSFRFMRGHL